MIFLWSGVSTLGMLVAIWYFGAILDRRGRINYPMILWHSTGHLISWLLMSLGVFSLFQLYTTTGNIELFLKFLSVIITLSLTVKSIFTPLTMPYIDQEGELFSRGGLRFGGVTTQDFIDATEPLSQKMDGIEIRIIGEAHYLITWLHSFPEIAFLIGMVLTFPLKTGPVETSILGYYVTPEEDWT